MSRNIFPKTFSFVAWITGIFVSLAVAFGMINKVLTIRWIPVGVTVVFGWIVVATTLIGVLIGIAKLFE